MEIQSSQPTSLQDQLATLPHKPGIYQFLDISGTIIYVGKAKNLKKRVSSYFKENDATLNTKTRVLVSKVVALHFTIVESEIDAWLLENNLIKKHQPRYNVLLKDDKTFPWIVIKNESFPRIIWTRREIHDGSTYFGPYASVSMMHTVLDLIRDIFTLRTCSLDLSANNIAKGKFKPCLEYQIGNCKAPCVALQSSEDYQATLGEIRNILSGRIAPILSRIKDEMGHYVSELQFEKAQLLKKKIELLEQYQSKSTVVNASISDLDVVNIASDAQYAFVNYLKVMNGTIVHTQTISVKKRLDEPDEEVLRIALSDFRTRFKSTSTQVLVPFVLEPIEGIKFIVPSIGDKKKLLDLSHRNVLYFRKERLEQYEKLNPELKMERILLQMQKDLRLKELPRHIECFDNSNFHGQYPISAIVVFKDAKPSKKDYRIFNVKTVEGPDDFATMEEAVLRRYKRMLDEQQPLPQLIIIDGGKGQLSSALQSLKALKIEHQVAIIGIAKRLEELYYPYDSVPLYLDKRSESLKIIQQLRDEAHRFGITAHRKKRNKGTLQSELNDIVGVGKTTTDKLLRHFKSVTKIKASSLEELALVIKPSLAKLVYEYFKLRKLI